MRAAELLAIAASSSTKDAATHEFFHHSSAKNVHTDAVITEAVKAQYPDLHLTVVPKYTNFYDFDILEFAAAGLASCTPMKDPKDKVPDDLTWRMYIPPPTKLNGSTGMLADSTIFGKYLYKWQDHEYFIYQVNCVEGYSSYVLFYVLGPSAPDNDGLVRAIAEYCFELHNQIWVFDQGFWQKSSQLFDAMKKSSWEDVILDQKMKNTIRNDVFRFFDSRERYEKLKVPWKRGIIYYGPPGNGKTISIKAMMHSLHSRANPIPSLYVRTLRNIWGPEYAIAEIFGKARQIAPCMLIFEDLDSMVMGDCRSYFLNEVDGIQPNDGVLMIGSTNHLERLDPGIAKRPSRFDRKFLFPKPDLAERTQYCEYWRAKLADNEDIDFPAELSPEIAKITDDFSFAYMQEAFIATLLAIASLDDSASNDDDYEDDENDEKYNEETNLPASPPPLAPVPTTHPTSIRARFLAEFTNSSDDSATATATTTTTTSDPGPGPALKALADEIGRALQRTMLPQTAAAAAAAAAATTATIGAARAAGTKPAAKDKFDDLLLWREMKKQVAILREEI